ncbi:MAG: carbon monoxide dehydrogenase [Candidatus Omnitrophota bacterium]|nr:carbon monoxide dehydrogenase [Candidatus Omnitrophota bacterium]
MAHLARNSKTSILAIDADPNSCLADNLGIKSPQTIVGICEEVSKNMDKIPAGVTKDRFIEMRVQEALIESEGFDLLVMGRPEGPGCYCYVNNLLRNIVGKIIANYSFVIIDNAAGMEHISRRTMREMSKLVLVSDYSIQGVRAAKKIYELAKGLGIKISGAYLIVNKVSGPIAALKDEITKAGLKDIGDMPYYDEVVEWNISGISIFEFKDKAIWSKIDEIFRKLIE